MGAAFSHRGPSEKVNLADLLKMKKYSRTSTVQSARGIPPLSSPRDPNVKKTTDLGRALHGCDGCIGLHRGHFQSHY